MPHAFPISDSARTVSSTLVLTWIEHWNDNPKPFVWTKTAEQILESIGAYCQRLLKLTNDSGH
jgi:hypothetical protein